MKMRFSGTAAGFACLVFFVAGIILHIDVNLNLGLYGLWLFAGVFGVGIGSMAGYANRSWLHVADIATAAFLVFDLLVGTGIATYQWINYGWFQPSLVMIWGTNSSVPIAAGFSSLAALTIERLRYARWSNGRTTATAK